MEKLILTRRQILTVAAALGSAPLLAQAARALGHYNLGEKQFTILSDGNLVLPLDFAFPDIAEADIKALLEQAGQPAGALMPDCNITMLRDGERIVLFDVGAGPNFMPTSGKLLSSMSEAGLDPAAVTDVIFTHAHPDHIWGLVDDFDEMIFANADYHINRMEWDYWRAGDTLQKTPEAQRSFVIGARNRFDYLEERIRLFDYGDEVLPDIEAVDTAGHTPGHTSFAIHNAGESLMVVGDAVTNVAVSFMRPEWLSGSDQDPQQALLTRRKLLDRLAGDAMGMVGYHMPHPGIGRVERKGTAFRFIERD